MKLKNPLDSEPTGHSLLQRIEHQFQKHLPARSVEGQRFIVRLEIVGTFIVLIIAIIGGICEAMMYSEKGWLYSVLIAPVTSAAIFVGLTLAGAGAALGGALFFWCFGSGALMCFVFGILYWLTKSIETASAFADVALGGIIYFTYLRAARRRKKNAEQLI